MILIIAVFEVDVANLIVTNAILSFISANLNKY